MSLKSENDLNPTNRNQIARAKQAEQSKNFDYAINLLQAVLKDEPLFLPGRQKLRVIEIQKYNALSSFNKQMLSVKVTTAAMKLSGLGKKEPGEQMALAEEVLALDPFNQKANAVIAEAGVALGHSELKAFAYETMAEGRPKDKVILNMLAKTYMDLKDGIKAEKTFQRILDIDPKDGEALSGMKNASAAHASRTGGWETSGGDYRKAIKNLDEAKQLEQEAKTIKSSDAIQEQIDLNLKKHNEDTANPLYTKTIANLFLQRNDYTNAILFFEHSYAAGGSVDSSLEKVISDLKLKKTDQELQALHTELDLVTDAEQQAQKQAEIDQKVTELNELRLSQAEARVRAQPNEGEFRYDLGEALYKIGQYKRATEELQQSLKQPSVRHKALNLMGMSFIERNMLDFAVSRLTLAESELLAMDELKKEIVYNLGLAYEKSKKPDLALEQWKKIYEFDMTYRDIARRVEESYGHHGGEHPA